MAGIDVLGYTLKQGGLMVGDAFWPAGAAGRVGDGGRKGAVRVSKGGVDDRRCIGLFSNDLEKTWQNAPLNPRLFEPRERGTARTVLVEGAGHFVLLPGPI